MRRWSAPFHRLSSRSARRRWLRRAGYLAAVVALALVAVQVGARLWLPQLAERRVEVADFLSERSGYRIGIERLEAYWEGLNPGLRAEGFTVHPGVAGPADVRLREVRLTLAWLPLLVGRTEINSLTLVQPSLALERREDGQLIFGGLDPAAAEPGLGGQGFARWLFAQRAIAVEDGELTWLDRLTREPAVRLRHVNLELRNRGERHRLALRAEFPPALCRGCGLTIDVRGNPLAGEPWSGQVQLRAIGLDPAALPRIVRERLPAEFAGEYSAQLWSEWHEGKLQSVYGRLGALGLRLPLPGARQALGIHDAETDLQWRARAGGWQLELRNLRLGLAGEPWWAGTLQIDREAEATRLRLSHLDLKDAAAFLAGLPGEEPASRWARALGPSGSLDDIDLQLRHTEAGDLDFALEAELADLAVRPHERAPGVRGVRGRLRAGPQEGEFVLSAAAGGLELPRVFREALPWRKASGRVAWKRAAGHWQIQTEGLQAQTEDGRLRGDFTLALPDAPGASPYLKLEAELRDGVGAHAARYYPAILPPAVRHWLETSVLDGEVTHGRVLIEGVLADFPFRDGHGRFEVTAHVRNGTLEYLPGWPPLTRIEADLLFRGAEMLITGHRGRIRDLAASQVTVRIADLERDPVLRVTGRAEGGVSEALDVLYRAPRPSAWSDFLPAGVRGAGRGRLVLDLSVPLSDDTPARLEGEYRLDRAALHLPLTGLGLEGLDGSVRFGNRGPTGAALRGRLLGGPFELTAETAPARVGDELRLRAAGRLTATGLGRVLGPAFAQRLEGAADWTAQFGLRGPVPEFRFDADLQDLGFKLPAPIVKARPAPARFSLRTTTAGADSHVLNVALGELLSGRLAFRRTPAGWRFAKGRFGIGVGPVALPPSDGLELELRAAELDGDAWLRFAREAAGGEHPPWGGILSRVQAEIGALRLFETPFGRLHLAVTRWPSGWVGQVDGAALAGDVLIAPGTPPSVTLELRHLRVPEEFFDAPALELDPRDLPPLRVASTELSLHGRNFGALKLETAPAPFGLRIEELRLSQPETTVAAKGQWNAASVGGRASTRLEVEAASSDLGRTLAAFGYPDELSGGRLELSSNWSWPGGPMEFGAAELAGRLQATLSDGRLLQIQQGAGQVLGILNLRSLVRFLTLDFRTLFGKGFAFDSLKGGFTVARGEARTGGIVIKGQNAAILITGRIGLAARDLDLEVDVLPRFKEELAITGLLLGNPAVGAAVLALQELFRRPIAEGTRVRYHVSGPWAEPVVTEPPRRPAAEPAAEEGR